jgi:predicted deacylase
MKSSRTDFKELSHAKLQDTRRVVISENLAMGGFTIAQHVTVTEGNTSSNIYLRGAIHVNELEGLYNLRDALNEAISKLEADTAFVLK